MNNSMARAPLHLLDKVAPSVLGFANNLKYIRHQLQITQSHLAVMLGVPRNSLHQWETEKNPCSEPIIILWVAEWAAELKEKESRQG